MRRQAPLPLSAALPVSMRETVRQLNRQREPDAPRRPTVSSPDTSGASTSELEARINLLAQVMRDANLLLK